MDELSVLRQLINNQIENRIYARKKKKKKKYLKQIAKRKGAKR
jgi:hypothetical protein